MNLVKIILLVAAAAGLFIYLPPLLTAHLADPTGLIVILAAAFFLGFIVGEAVEFCADRLHLYRRL